MIDEPRNLEQPFWSYVCTRRCLGVLGCSIKCDLRPSLVVSVCVVEEDDVWAPEHPGGDPEDLDPAVVGGVPPQLEVVPHHRHPHVRRHYLPSREREAANLIYPGYRPVSKRAYTQSVADGAADA